MIGAIDIFQEVLNDENSSATQKKNAEMLIALYSGAVLSPLLPPGIIRTILMVLVFSLGFLAFLTPHEWLFWCFFLAFIFSPRVVGIFAYRLGEFMGRHQRD